MDERDCKNCEYSKPYYSKVIKRYIYSCSRWDCIYEESDNEEHPEETKDE